MSKRSKLIVSKLAAAIVIILIFVGCCGLSLIVTCGIVKLITMWLILCLLKGSFNGSQKN